MNKSNEQVTISNIIHRLEKLEQFKLHTLNNIHELYEFKADTIKDINELDEWKESQDTKKWEDYPISDTFKDKIIRNFLELNMDINKEDKERLMAIPRHKLQDYQKEDLDNCDQVYWACKILLEYIGEGDDD